MKKARNFGVHAVEFLVVGSGPGGALTAAELAERGQEVTVLEEGPGATEVACAPFSLQEMEDRYRNAGMTPALGKPKIPYVEACCEGGGSEVNSGLYHRTPMDVLEKWRMEFGLVEATEEVMRPHFEAVEKELSVGCSQVALPAASLKMAEGAAALNWSHLEVPRWMRWENGVGIRQTMSRTCLLRAKQAGARVETGWRAVRLRRAGSQWQVEAHQREGKRRRVVKARNVILCGGAVQTPLLLQKSGFRGSVGDNFQLHPTVKVVARFDQEVNSPGMGVPVHQVKQFAPRISLGCSISSPPFLAIGLLDFPDWLRRLREEWRRMAAYYAMIVPEGRGQVRPMPFFDSPLVRFRLTEGDMAALAEGLRRLCELLFAAGATHLFPSVSGLGPFMGLKDLEKIPPVLPRGATQLMTIHLFSSCPMGEDPARCVTDSFGRFRGGDGLFINDASLLPSAPGVNPQGTIMAFARRNVHRWLELG